MTRTSSAWDVALEPVRARLLADAQAEAARLRASAEQDGERALAEAREHAAAVLAEAREQGAADAATLHAAERGRSHRGARGIVLAAQRAAFEELREQAGEAVRELVADPVRRAGLEVVVRDRIGNQAVVRSVADGGLVAEAPDGRRVDASVRALVDDAIARLDLGQLWAP